jgi:hypothetical protein
MRNISLPQYVVCKTDPSFVKVKINCVFWDMQDNCSAYCSEKKKNVSELDCKRCDIRKPYVGVDNQQNTSPAADLQNLPQFNHYVVENSDNETTFLDKAKSYSKAEISQMFKGKVSQEIFEKRKSLCMACPSRVNNDQSEAIGWCKSCGCSTTNKRASLSNKLWMPSLECPLKKFGKEIGEGFKASDAADSVKGIITSVKDLFLKDK